MNQILSVENTPKEKKTSGPVEISKIVMFFCISLIVFGVFMIGSGSYAIYKGQQVANSKQKPSITVEKSEDGNNITLRITNNKAISQVTYTWGDEEPTVIEGGGRKSITQELEIPSGTNELKVTAVDTAGLEGTFNQTYTKEGDAAITFEPNGSNLRIRVESKEEISYFTYRWNDDEEETVDVNSTVGDCEIEIPMGLNKLTVVAVDVNNNTTEKSQEVNGVKKPKVEVKTNGEYFIIVASDETNLTRMEVIINEDQKYSLTLNQQSIEYEFPYPLEAGTNKIEVTVYNNDGQTAEYKAKVDI